MSRQVDPEYVELPERLQQAEDGTWQVRVRVDKQDVFLPLDEALGTFKNKRQRNVVLLRPLPRPAKRMKPATQLTCNCKPTNILDGDARGAASRTSSEPAHR